MVVVSSTWLYTRFLFFKHILNSAADVAVDLQTAVVSSTYTEYPYN